MDSREPTDQDAPNEEPEAGEKLVSEWFHRNANEVARERETTCKQLQDALRERDGKKGGEALDSLAERLFFRVQADLARQVVDSKDHTAALFGARDMIKSNVSSLYREVFGIPLAEVWLSCFDRRMEVLCGQYGGQRGKEKKNAFVVEWFCHNAALVTRERETAREQLREAKRTSDERYMGLALGSFAERMFLRVQNDLARQIDDPEDYAAALRAMCYILRSDVDYLCREVVGQPIGQEWLSMFDRTMQNLCQKYGEQYTTIEIVVQQDQVVQITGGGTPEESGIRLVPKKARVELRAFVQQRIRELGYHGIRGLADESRLSPQVIYNLFNGKTVSSTTIQVLASVLATPLAEFADLVEKHQAICRLQRSTSRESSPDGHKMDTPPVDNFDESS